MENTVQLKKEEMLQYKFDLKGSTYHGRRTKGVVTSKTDRKDLDFLELKNNKLSAKYLEIASINQHLINILERDIQFLRRHGLIDYSLLLAFELSTNRYEPEKLVEKRIQQNLKQATVTAIKFKDMTRLQNLSKITDMSLNLLKREKRVK